MPDLVQTLKSRIYGESMSLLSELEKKYGRFAVANVTLVIVAGQVIFYLLVMSKAIGLEHMTLIAANVLQGQVWRLFTFVFVPPIENLVFALFAWYLFYLMGTALEQHWGVFRYNIFLSIGYIATVAVSFIAPAEAATNAFLGGSVFLAFAFLYPDFQVYLFFLLPVKVKWLALLTWVGYFISLVFGGWTTRLVVLASVSNFLLFFGRDILLKIKAHRRRMAIQAQQFAESNKPMHRCTVCGVTDLTDPDIEFRYCGQCKPVRGYCMDHIANHEHVVKDKA